MQPAYAGRSPVVGARRTNYLPNRQEKPPSRSARESRSWEQLSEKIISCGAEFWLASDAFCGLAYAALFQISSFPQGLPITYMSCNRHPVWVNRVL